MKKIWARKAKSFKEAEEFDRGYYLQMGAKKRLETMQFLREIYEKFYPSGQRQKKGLKYARRKGLRGFIRIVQQEWR